MKMFQFDEREKYNQTESISDRHREIEKMTADYLAKGGKITICPPFWPKRIGLQVMPTKGMLGFSNIDDPEDAPEDPYYRNF